MSEPIGEVASEVTTASALKDFERRLHRQNLQGHWEHVRGALSPEPRLAPHHWRWDEVYGALSEAGQLIPLDGDTVARRTIRLVNPALAHTTQSSTHTLHMSVQLVKPGEVAAAHRHTLAAIRFVLSGRSAVTTVDGEALTMSPRDLILTPNWAWHDHTNSGTEPTVWLDGLDIPLVRYFGAAFFEPYSSLVQPRRKEGGLAALHRGLVPIHHGNNSNIVSLHYSWEDAALCLEAALEDTLDPYDGVLLEYSDQRGRHTLPTMSCMLQALPAGYATLPHRHTSSAIFHVLEGTGTALVGDTSWDWAPGDFFVVPNWTRHSLTNGRRFRTILFVMSDLPQLEAFGLHRVQEG